MKSDRQARARALTDLASIAERMQGRLLTMPLASKRRIVEILGIEVRVTVWESHGSGEHPAEVVITGRLDPRLFADGGGGDRDGTPDPGSRNTNGTAQPRGRWARSLAHQRRGALVPLVFIILPVTIVFAIFPGILVLQFGF